GWRWGCSPESLAERFASSHPRRPCLLRLWLNGIRQTTPAARRVPRLLPPPPEGAGKCLAIDPVAVSRGEIGF
ncbi:MAG TPA: hypothetical protein PKH62_05465, partial [Methanoculleus sp.]|nr:hypothetical protein [Methanoculleus sp.]